MKAQFWSFDVIFAIVIFAFVIVLLTYVWLNVSGEFSLSYSANIAHMEAQAQDLGVQLLSRGTPSNWDYAVNLASEGTWQNISIGLGNGTEEMLSQHKINMLQNMSGSGYQATKSALNIAYDYYITIVGNGVNISIGFNPSLTNITAVQSTSLPVIVGGRAAQMQIELWSNSTLGIE